MAGLIGNTDASGQVGGKVAALLAARGNRQRLIVPDAAAAPDLPGAEISVLADESDSQAMQAALAGVDTVFLVPSGSGRIVFRFTAARSTPPWRPGRAHRLLVVPQRRAGREVHVGP